MDHACEVADKDRIAASREQDGWARRDIDTARQAAAAARLAAITALEEQS